MFNMNIHNTHEIFELKLIYVPKVNIFVLFYSYIIMLVTKMNERVPMCQTLIKNYF